MKNLFFIAFVFFLFCFASCAGQNCKEVLKSNVPPETERVVKVNITENQLAMKADPVCRMPAFRYLKDTTIYNGKIYGFCCTVCKEKFLKSPEKYVKNP